MHRTREAVRHATPLAIDGLSNTSCRYRKSTNFGRGISPSLYSIRIDSGGRSICSTAPFFAIEPASDNLVSLLNSIDVTFASGCGAPLSCPPGVTHAACRAVLVRILHTKARRICDVNHRSVFGATTRRLQYCRLRSVLIETLASSDPCHEAVPAYWNNIEDHTLPCRP